MQLHQVAELVFLLALLGEGDCSWVNLTEEAYKYIKSIERPSHPIDDWDITGNHPFWRSHRKLQKEYPIYASVQNLRCTKTRTLEMKTEKVKRYKRCTIRLAWEVNDGVYNPFNMKTTVQVPMLGNWSKIPTEIDLSSTKMIYKDLFINANWRMVRSRKTCEFMADVIFQGFFVYHKDVTHWWDDMGDYETAGVGILKNPAKKLIQLNDTALKYVVIGMYTQNVSCH